MRAASDKNFKYIFNTGIDEYMKCKLYQMAFIVKYCTFAELFGFSVLIKLIRLGMIQRGD